MLVDELTPAKTYEPNLPIVLVVGYGLGPIARSFVPEGQHDSSQARSAHFLPCLFTVSHGQR